jgi:hypothetical protein
MACLIWKTKISFVHDGEMVEISIATSGTFFIAIGGIEPMIGDSNGKSFEEIIKIAKDSAENKVLLSELRNRANG